MLPLLRNAIILMALLIGLVFGYFNTSGVTVDYLLGQQDMPLVMALSIALLIGLALGILITMPSAIRQRAEAASMKRRLHQTESELKNLRNLPLHDG